MKTAIVLAGRHEVTEERYQPIIDEFKNAGWPNVLLHRPDWQKLSIEELVAEFTRSLTASNAPLTLLGFSLGAMIALIASSKIGVENIVLCSPSGYFLEYDSLLSVDDRKWAEKKLGDYKTFSAKEIIAGTTAKNGFIIAGETELRAPDFKHWLDDLKSSTQWSYTELPNTGHEIEAPNYQNAIKTVIYTLA